MSEPATLTAGGDAWLSAVMTRGLRQHYGIGLPGSVRALGSQLPRAPSAREESTPSVLAGPGVRLGPVTGGAPAASQSAGWAYLAGTDLAMA